MTAHRSAWFTGKSGNRLHAVEAGSGSAGCLLLHGFGDGAYVWDDVIDDLAGVCRVVALDLRGHGDSEWASDGDYGIDEYVGDVRQVVLAMNAEPLIVVGHSLGASIGVRLAVSQPGRIGGLALLDYSPEAPREVLDVVHGNFGASRSRSFKDAEAYKAHLFETRPMLAPAQAEKLANGALTVTHTGELTLKADPDIVRGRTKTSEASIRASWHRLRALDTPTLVVRGQASATLSAATARRMAAEIPSARLGTVRRAGHSLLSDNPTETRAFVRDFVRDRLREPPTRGSAFGPGTRVSTICSTIRGD